MRNVAVRALRSTFVGSVGAEVCLVSPVRVPHLELKVIVALRREQHLLLRFVQQQPTPTLGPGARIHKRCVGCIQGSAGRGLLRFHGPRFSIEDPELRARDQGTQSPGIIQPHSAALSLANPFGRQRGGRKNNPPHRSPCCPDLATRRRRPAPSLFPRLPPAAASALSATRGLLAPSGSAAARPWLPASCSETCCPARCRASRCGSSSRPAPTPGGTPAPRTACPKRLARAARSSPQGSAHPTSHQTHARSRQQLARSAEWPACCTRYRTRETAYLPE
eukprot:3461649-Rhodomonas_salina.3